LYDHLYDGVHFELPSHRYVFKNLYLTADNISRLYKYMQLFR